MGKSELIEKQLCYLRYRRPVTDSGRGRGGVRRAARACQTAQSLTGHCCAQGLI